VDFKVFNESCAGDVVQPRTRVLAIFGETLKIEDMDPAYIEVTA
jgi:hypothetical protein